MITDDTGPVRYYSDDCHLGYPESCTGVANPNAATRHRLACHGHTHIATF